MPYVERNFRDPKLFYNPEAGVKTGGFRGFNSKLRIWNGKMETTYRR